MHRNKFEEKKNVEIGGIILLSFIILFEKKNDQKNPRADQVSIFLHLDTIEWGSKGFFPSDEKHCVHFKSPMENLLLPSLTILRTNNLEDQLNFTISPFIVNPFVQIPSKESKNCYYWFTCTIKDFWKVPNDIAFAVVVYPEFI